MLGYKSHRAAADPKLPKGSPPPPVNIFEMPHSARPILTTESQFGGTISSIEPSFYDKFEALKFETIDLKELLSKHILQLSRALQASSTPSSGQSTKPGTPSSTEGSFCSLERRSLEYFKCSARKIKDSVV